jgi:hypothetical protein
MSPAEAARADAKAGSAPLKMPRRYRRRRWLNRLGYQTTAFVYADLECSVEDFKDGKKHMVWIQGSFTISDCTRQITLDIQGDQNTIDKLNALAAALLDARDWVQAAKDWKEERE